MDFTNIVTCLRVYEKEINKRLNTSEYMTHSHPPTNRIMKDCLYCKKYGNVFSKMDEHDVDVFKYIKKI